MISVSQKSRKTRTQVWIGLFLTCFVFIGLSTGFSNKNQEFDQMWKEVDALYEKKMYQSCLSLIDKIYEKAEKLNNEDQRLKCILAKTGIWGHFLDDSEEKAEVIIEDFIQKAKTPLKELASSALAEFYWSYYSHNKWKIEQIKTTNTVIPEDFKQWSTENFIVKCKELYEESLNNPEILKQHQLGLFESSILKDSTTYPGEFTVYEFLERRYTRFLENKLMSQDQFIDWKSIGIPKKQLLEDYNSFTKINTKNEEADLSTLVKEYQKLYTYYQELNASEKLVYLDLDRLMFVNGFIKLKNQDSLYLSSLEKLKKDFASNPVSTEVQYKIASTYIDETVFPFGTQSPKEQPLAKAKKIAEDAIKAFPNSPGTKRCEQLISNIESKNLEFEMEGASLPSKPFRVLVKHKNISTVYAKIFKLDPNNDQDFYQQKDLNPYLLSKALKTYEFKIPVTSDYSQHSIELPFEALEKGKYLLVLSNNKSFNKNNCPIASNVFWITNLGYAMEWSTKNNNEIFVFNRTTGQPQKDVAIEVFYRDYSKNGKPSDNKLNLITNAEGLAEFNLNDGLYANKMVIKKGDELLVTTGFNIHRPYNRELGTETRIEFFTDRSIYRPGQTVYFKGVVHLGNGQNEVIVPNHTTTVYLKNSSHQTIDSVKLTSNIFGSFHGSFKIPGHILNGEIILQCDGGSKHFRVEEYKRPTFSVQFNDVKDTYKLNEIVGLSGFAESYTGVKVKGAKVNYKVTRYTNFLFRPYETGYKFFPSSPPVEILAGSTETDENGQFNIQVELFEDENGFNWPGMVQTFEINVDVTDLSGETQAGTTQIKASEKSYTLGFNLPNEINIDNHLELNIQAENLNGKPVDVKGFFKIFVLEETPLLRPAVWDKPEQAYLNKNEFKKMFPLDEYLHETNPDSLKRMKEILSGNINTSDKTQMVLQEIEKLSPGRYVLEATVKNNDGETVSSKHYFTAFSPRSKTSPVMEFLWSVDLNKSLEPGQKASFLVGTADNNTLVTLLVENKGKVIKKEFFEISKEQRKIEIPVKEDYRGDFYVHIFAAKQNRSFNYHYKVTVPFTNKKLEIQLESFRDKIEPGTKEKWLLKVENKEPTEVLAYMYDLSLDAIVDHHQVFDIYHQNYPVLSITKDALFGSSYARIWWDNNHQPNMPPPYPSIPEINWPYQNYITYNYSPIYGKREMRYKNVNMMAMAEESIEDSNRKDSEMAAGIPPAKTVSPPTIKLREALGETAFFLPNLVPEKGLISLDFTAPDALTTWKFVVLAHDKDLKTGSLIEKIVTRKNLMVKPNLPRFYREKDSVEFTASVVNLSDKILEVKSTIGLTSLGQKNQQFNGEQTLTLQPEETQIISKKFKVPYNAQGIIYEVKAWTNGFSDGERGEIAVLPASQIVIETLPLSMQKVGTKTFKLSNLLASSSSNSLHSKELTLSYQTNAKLSVLLAIAPLVQPKSKSIDQLLGVFHGCLVAKKELQKHPVYSKILAIAQNDKYKKNLSALSRNENLKNLLLEESPWSLNAEQELDNMVQLILDLDNGKIEEKLLAAEKEIIETQLYNGSWPWFPGMRENRYITQKILVGLARLKKLYPEYFKNRDLLNDAFKKGIKYVTSEINNDYAELKKDFSSKELKKEHINSLQIQYLYLISLVNNTENFSTENEAMNYLLEQSKKFWNKKSLMEEAMISMVLNGSNEKKTAQEIVESLKERAINKEELAIYWKMPESFGYWYHAPVETQALLIEAFINTSADRGFIKGMSTWLLNHKQGNQWQNNQETYAATYALQLQKEIETAPLPYPSIKMGNQNIYPTNENFDESKTQTNMQSVLTAIGYYQKTWPASEITPSMGEVTVTANHDGLTWGALFWKYEEDLSRIKEHQTNLKISRKLFKQITENNRTKYVEITDNTALNPGDKLRIKLIFGVDRPLEFIHLKDMRAACAEPIDVLSSAVYSNGLGYYRAINDASTEFFFDYLPKGEHTLEYEVALSQKGNYAKGIASIQSIYAPGFSAHTSGAKLRVQ